MFFIYIDVLKCSPNLLKLTENVPMSKNRWKYNFQWPSSLFRSNFYQFQVFFLKYAIKILLLTSKMDSTHQKTLVWYINHSSNSNNMEVTRRGGESPPPSLSWLSIWPRKWILWPKNPLVWYINHYSISHNMEVTKKGWG